MLILLACESNSTQQPKAENTTSQEQSKEAVNMPQEAAAEKYCFRRTFGADSARQDIWEAELTIDGSKVRGNYNWIPFEKDSGRGSFLGVMDGGIITAIWNYTIEGSQQKEEVIFKFSEKELSQKEGQLEEVNGILKLKDPENAQWSEPMQRIDCEE